ncbi:MAG: hypothetical protein GY940_33225 [bacterium]|nr:hypothetical protein [bacterium]
MKRIVVLKINDKRVPLNKYVKRVIGNVIAGLIKSLDGIPEEQKKIELSIEFREDKKEQ